MDKSNIIKHYRTALGLTQQALADTAGVHIRQIQKLEGGERTCENLALITAISIADALKITVYDLVPKAQVIERRMKMKKAGNPLVIKLVSQYVHLLESGRYIAAAFSEKRAGAYEPHWYLPYTAKERESNGCTGLIYSGAIPSKVFDAYSYKQRASAFARAKRLFAHEIHSTLYDMMEKEEITDAEWRAATDEMDEVTK